MEASQASEAGSIPVARSVFRLAARRAVLLCTAAGAGADADADADRLISYPDAHNLSVKQQPIRAHRQGCNDDAGVKGADGQRQGQAGVLVGSGRAWPGTC